MLLSQHYRTDIPQHIQPWRPLILSVALINDLIISMGVDNKLHTLKKLFILITAFVFFRVHSFPLMAGHYNTACVLNEYNFDFNCKSITAIRVQYAKHKSGSAMHFTKTNCCTFKISRMTSLKNVDIAEIALENIFLIIR